MTHELKILPMYFQAVWDGKKTFEIRKNDRGFMPGDMLVLKEWNGKKYTGSALCVRVSYMLTDTIDGIEPGYCVLGIKHFGEREGGAGNA